MLSYVTLTGEYDIVVIVSGSEAGIFNSQLYITKFPLSVSLVSLDVLSIKQPVLSGISILTSFEEIVAGRSSLMSN